MTINDEKRMINIAKREIEIFSEKWKKDPYLWESEADIHAELYWKIKSSIHKEFKCKKFRCSWKENGEIKKMLTEEYFDWVYCEPKTYIRGESNCYYPDIVIYKDTGEKRFTKERENGPMLWACEIKYATEWSSDISDSIIKKAGHNLMKFLKQKGDGTGTDHACLLVFFRWINQYKSKTMCEKNKRDIYSRVNKIKAILNSLKNKRIDTHFYRELEFKYEK